MQKQDLSHQEQDITALQHQGKRRDENTFECGEVWEDGAFF